MDLDSFRALLAPDGQAVLAEAEALQPREVDFLANLQRLNRRLDRTQPSGLAQAALETAILRKEAAEKFPFAGKMYFTRQALEQASSYAVSCYRSERFRPFTRLVDLGCSIGGDTLALSTVAATLGIDLDPLRLAMARANLQALGSGERSRLVRADLSTCLPLQEATGAALFFDPARRSEGRRVYSVSEYRPPLDIVAGWLERFPELAVKISPGVDMQELATYEAEVEFISLKGELKEAVLWLGALKSAFRRATVLPGPHSLEMERFPEEPALQPLAAAPQAFLYEPDPAVIRVGLVRRLGEQLGAAQLDPDIAYLTAEKLTPTPFARAWAIEAWFPFQLKRLRAYLRERGVGQLVVKKRGSPLQPEALIRELRLSGQEAKTVFLTHLKGRPVVLVAGMELEA
jgi:hypothetical protein